MDAPLGVAYVSWIASLRVDDDAYAEELATAACDEFRAIGADFGLAHALEGRALVLVRAGSCAAPSPSRPSPSSSSSGRATPGAPRTASDAASACLAQVGDLGDGNPELLAGAQR